LAQFGWHGCPDPVRDQVHRLVDAFRSELGGDLVGAYLHGSLALGCFNPLRSDLDLLAVTRAPMAVETKRRLAELLLAESGRPNPVEISFLAQADLAPWRHPTPFDFHFSIDWRAAYIRDLANDAWRDWNAVRHCDADLAGHITVTRRRGVRLYGPPALLVFPPVPRADYLASVLADVLDPVFGLDSVLSHPTYVILNACRTLAYLRTGHVLSKVEGGAWASQILPERFRPAVIAALDAYRDDADDRALDAEAMVALADHLRAEVVALV
jgi:predicted nucleotidyltransferase